MPNGWAAPGQGCHGRLPVADRDPPILQGMPAASLTPSWAMLPMTAMVMAPSVSATHHPSPPRLSAGGRATHPIWPSLQGMVLPAAPRASRTAWARQKFPMAMWVSPGAVVRWLAWPQPCRGSMPGQRQAAPTEVRCQQRPSSAPLSFGKGPWVASLSVPAHSKVSIDASRADTCQGTPTPGLGPAPAPITLAFL